MRTWVVALAIAASSGACGRVAFDTPRVDETDAAPKVCTTPVGHDEDGDGVDDACDVCPHRADANQEDADGDGVGDACDPEPSNPRQTIAFFDPMIAARPELVENGPSFAYVNDAAVIDARIAYSYFQLDRSVENDDIEWRASFENGMTTQHQMTITGNESSTGAFFYCELEDETAGFYWRLTYTYDQSNYTMPDDQTLSGTLGGSTVTMRMGRRGQQVGCDSSWPSSRGLTGPIPADIHGDYLSIGMKDVRVTLQYLVIIHTQ